MNELGILSFGQLYRYVVLCTRFYVTEFKMPVVKKRTLRQTERFHIPRIFTKYGRGNTPSYVPSMLNSVPAELLNINSLQEVKKVLKNWCLVL